MNMILRVVKATGLNSPPYKGGEPRLGGGVVLFRAEVVLLHL
jgi:hypothetical protein